MEGKLPSSTEDQPTKLAVLHFESFWAQKVPTRDPKIDKKSMKVDAKINGKFGWVLAEPWERVLLTLECFWDPGPLNLSVSFGRGAIFQNFVVFMFGLIFL